MTDPKPRCDCAEMQVRTFIGLAGRPVTIDPLTMPWAVKYHSCAYIRAKNERLLTKRQRKRREAPMPAPDTTSPRFQYQNGTDAPVPPPRIRVTGKVKSIAKNGKPCRLRSPDGKTHNVENLSEWVRTHKGLFAARDVVEYRDGNALYGPKCRAVIGLRVAKMTGKTWKGWRVMP